MELDILDIVLMVSKQCCSGVTRRVVAVSDIVGRGEKEAFFFICAILFKRRCVRGFNRLVDSDCCCFT